MIRSLFAFTAIVGMAAGGVAHVLGAEPAAELCGDGAFVLLALAVIAWPRDKERRAGDD